MQKRGAGVVLVIQVREREAQLRKWRSKWIVRFRNTQSTGVNLNMSATEEGLDK